MKNIFKIIFLFVVIFNHNNINAQEEIIDTINYTFTSIDFDNDYNILKKIGKEHKGNERIWAKNLINAFPLNENGVIEIKYNIKSNKIINIKKLNEISVDWFSYAFSDVNVITKIDEEGVIKGKGVYTNISQYSVNVIYYAKIVNISVDLNIGIKINDNNINIIILVKHYNVVSGDSLLRGENSLISIDNTYPNIESNNKLAYARAFINTYANSYYLISDYINFINKNTNKVKDELEFTW